MINNYFARKRLFQKKLTKKFCRLVGTLVKRIYIFVMIELLYACFVPQPAEKRLNPERKPAL
jgi:hypothetical protein